MEGDKLIGLEITMRTKALLWCGIVSSLLYVGMNILVPVFYNGYNSFSMTVSELSAIGAPTRTLWVWLGALWTLLVIFFGWGVWRSAGQNRSLRISGILILLYGIVSVVWPFAPMHPREVLAAGGKSLTDTLHLVLASVTVLFMLCSMGFGAAAFGKKFRWYTLVTMVSLLFFGGLTGSEAPKVEANLPTPYAGLWERINIGLFLVWIIVLAVILLHRKQKIRFVH